MTVSDATSNLRNHVQEDSNGVAATDSVAELLEVVGEAWGIQALYQVHASMVKSLRSEDPCVHITAINSTLMD